MINVKSYFWKGLLIKLIASFFLIINIAQIANGQRNLLQNEYSRAGSAASIANISAWRVQEKTILLNSIQELPRSVKNNLIIDADLIMQQSWPVLNIANYREYKENGNRVNFEQLYLIRRSKLSILCAAELADGKKKYLSEIIKGIELILDEQTWVLPAHYYTKKRVQDPDPGKPIIDLFATETAAHLVWIKLLMNESISAIQPALIARIDQELVKRVLNPYLESDDYWWMGLKTNRKQNNWNIWINSNMLKVAAIADNNVVRRTAIIEKVIKSADKFINPYPADGGCDEGPAYWSAAGGCLGELISMLNRISGGKLDWSKNELIRNIGTYIYKVHIDGVRFVNFADAPAATIPDPGRVYNFAELFNDALLKSFASYLATLNSSVGRYLNPGSINIFANSVRTFKDLNTIAPKAPLLQNNWLPDIEVVNLRPNTGSSKGLTFMAKAGNNDESHNHNDIGNFMIYANGDPVIIDIGKGTYTRETFGPNRYDIWFNQSAWHNCPTINGSDEQAGASFKAEKVSLRSNKSRDIFSMDIAKAFPDSAHVKSWMRSFKYDRINREIVLKDQYELENNTGEVNTHFITFQPPQIIANGTIKVTSLSKTNKVVMNYDPSLFKISIECKNLEDESFRSVWGIAIYKITLSAVTTKLKAEYRITFK